MVDRQDILEEGRSKNRFLHTVSNAFADNIISFLKNNPDRINDKNIVTKPEEFIGKEDLKALSKLKSITIFIIKKPNIKNLIRIPEAAYYHKNMSDTYGDSSYKFKRGEISFKVEVDEKINSFEQLQTKYSKLYSDLSELFRHEVEHYVDDRQIKGGLEAQDKERSPYYFLTPEQKEEFNYYIAPYEIKAYVKQFMEEAKRSREPFYRVLVDYLKTKEEFSTFNRDNKLKDILYVLIYKYLEFASTIYNSVREDENAMKYLQKLGSYLDDKGLYIPEEEVSESFNHDKFKEWLKEGSDLSKYWKKRAKSRAKRAGRSPNNATDKNWALEQEEKSKDISISLKKAFDEQIKESEALSKQIEEIIAFQAKKKNLSKDPFVNGITGRMKGFKQKHKGAKKIAPGESFGPLEEEDDETN
jgi:ribosomal protein S16